MLERAAQELAPFLDEVAFVGGATIALWITDEGAPVLRVTKDVDLVVEVASRAGWYRFEERLRAHGLLDQPRFLDAIDGTVVGFGRRGSGDGDRVEEIVLPRLRALAER